MTRTRFIKLLMARGCTRNEASYKAEYARRVIGNYDTAMYVEDLKSFVESDSFTQAINALTAAIDEAAQAIALMATNLVNAGLFTMDEARAAYGLDACK